MSDLKDDDHTRFLEVGDDGPFSREQRSSYTLPDLSTLTGRAPGFVSDEYLGTISDEKTATATELCLAGLWERAEGGYRVNDEEAVARVSAMHLRKAGLQDECLAGGRLRRTELEDVESTLDGHAH